MLVVSGRFDIGIVRSEIVVRTTAFEITGRYAGMSMILLENECEIAHDETGHNSRLIHPGVFYREGSAKARTYCGPSKRAIAVSFSPRAYHEKRFSLAGY
jgi:L-2-hydroxyglutarate oxidase LhgO